MPTLYPGSRLQPKRGTPLGIAMAAVARLPCGSLSQSARCRGILISIDARTAGVEWRTLLPTPGVMAREHQHVRTSTLNRGSSFCLTAIVAAAVRSYSLLPTNSGRGHVGSTERKIAKLSGLARTGEHGS